MTPAYTAVLQLTGPCLRAHLTLAVCPHCCAAGAQQKLCQHPLLLALLVLVLLHQRLLLVQAMLAE
jgi:hypothetical protein